MNPAPPSSIHLHLAPPSSIHLHLAPSSSIHLHPAHFNLHPAPSTSTQLISVSTQLSATPSTIFNQNIARNWAISLNLDRKIKSCPFWLKIGTHGILEVLVSKSRLSIQIRPKNGFRFGIWEKWSQNKNQHPQDLGLKFEKTNIEMRINIFEILCVYVRVCQFSGKTNSFDFFSSNLPKSGSRVGNSENHCRNKNQHPRYTLCTNVQSKWTTLNFSAQICLKKI